MFFVRFLFLSFISYHGHFVAHWWTFTQGGTKFRVVMGAWQSDRQRDRERECREMWPWQEWVTERDWDRNKERTTVRDKERDFFHCDGWVDVWGVGYDILPLRFSLISSMMTSNLSLLQNNALNLHKPTW